MNTIAIRTQLNKMFKTLNDNIYYEIADDDAPYPHLVYELKEIINDYGKTTYDLEVNIFDYGNSTSAIEQLGDDLGYLLDKYYFINDEIQFASYKSTRIIVQEDDKKIRRRRLTFEIQAHELKGV